MYILTFKKFIIFIKNLKEILTINTLVLFFVKHSKNTILQYKYLHKNNAIYGTTSVIYFDIIKDLINKIRPKNIIDFGCGKGVLSDKIEKELHIKCAKYDPAIVEYNKIPNKKFDLLLCTDVLEHIPLEKLGEVLNSIKKLSDNCFLAISCRLAEQILPNGENAHCTVRPKEWWKKYLNKYYKKIEELDFWDKSAVIFVAKN